MLYSMKIDFVVTHYDGNIDSIKKKINTLKLKVNLIIYNKKNNDYGIHLENKGVDAYDKMYHIINNYDNLADITIFTTDNVFTNKKKIKKINFILDNLVSMDGFLTGHIIKNKEEHSFTLDTYNKKKIILSPIRPFYKWFKHYINPLKDKSEDFYFCKKSIFAVSKELILSHSIDFYKNLLTHIKNYSVEGHDSEVPHYFERAWVEIFCGTDINKMNHDTNVYGNINAILIQS